MAHRSRRVAAAGLGLAALYFAVAFLSARLDWLTGVEDAVPGPAPDPVAIAPVPRALGAVGVHTGRSHDAVGTAGEVADAAHRAGLDFVFVSDHRAGDAPDSLWKRGPEYRHGVLMLWGQEISLGGDVGRVLVFGLDTAVTRWDEGVEAFARTLERHRATAVVAHSRSRRTRDSWRPRRAPGIAGWEAFDLADVGRDRLHGPWVVYHLVALAVSYPLGRAERSLLRLYREGFDRRGAAAFDSVYATGPLTAVAGLDVHPKTRLFGRPIPGYDPFFRTLINHVDLRAPLPADGQAAADSLTAAFRRRRSFISFGDAADADDFTFAVRYPNGPDSANDDAGDRMRGPEPHATIHASSPSTGGRRILFRVLRDGRSVAWIRGPSLRWPVPGSGAYRVELYRYTARIGPLVWNLRPWIFTNPIRVPPEPGQR